MHFRLICAFVLLISTSVAWAGQFLEDTEACLVTYLKEKGKIPIDFQSSIETFDHCADRPPLMYQSLRSFVDNEVKKKMTPAVSKCLLDSIDNQDTTDHLVMIYILRLNKFLSDSEMTVKLETTRSQLKEELEGIAQKCETSTENFVKIFHPNLGIRNETLEALQYEYCIVQYCVENKFLEMDNYEMNRNGIATDNINCTAIIDTDRKNAEKEFADDYITTPDTIEAKACIMQAYRTEKRYEWFLALKVLGNEVNARRTKEKDVINVTNKLTGRAFMELFFNCVAPTENLVVTLNSKS